MRQVRSPSTEADVVVCVLDGSEPPTQADREAVNLLRRSRSRSSTWRTRSTRRSAPGRGERALRARSAGHRADLGAPRPRYRQLAAAVAAKLPPIEEETPSDDETPRVALIGSPNAGKSSLAQSPDRRGALARRRRVRERRATPSTVASPSPARNSSSSTPRGSGGGRASSAASSWSAFCARIRAIERAQVVVVLCDATQGVAEQDARLLGLCIERRRAIVVGLNKIDVVPRNERKKVIRAAGDMLCRSRAGRRSSVSPRRPGGATTSSRVSSSSPSEEIHQRIPTAALNRFFRSVLQRSRRQLTAGARRGSTT